MRIPVIAGNWKMNKNIVESLSLVKELKDFERLGNVIEGTLKIDFQNILEAFDKK